MKKYTNEDGDFVYFDIEREYPTLRDQFAMAALSSLSSIPITQITRTDDLNKIILARSEIAY